MLQIQPFYKDFSAYNAFAQKNGLFYEVLELSFDQIPDCVRSAYTENKNVRSIHGAFIDVNPGSGDHLFRQLSEKRYEESCRLAVDCKAKNVVFHSTCFPFLRGYYIGQWADRCAAFYTYLAEKYPELTLFIENSPDIDPTPIKMLTDKLTVKNVAVCLDIGHIHYSSTSPEKWFDELGERVRYLHLSDNKGIYDDHLPIGSGSVDWASISSLCAYLPNDIPITFEVGGIPQIEASLDYIRENGYFGGKIE